MRFPEWLYRMLPGDAGTQQLGVIWRENSSTQNAASATATIYTVPNDKCLVLTNATLRVSGQVGAGSISRRRLIADPPSGATRYNILDDEAGATTPIVLSNNWQGEVVIPGGWFVKVTGDFAAADPANFIDGEIHGYLIPRGTFVFG